MPPDKLAFRQRLVEHVADIVDRGVANDLDRAGVRDRSRPRPHARRSGRPARCRARRRCRADAASRAYAARSPASCVTERSVPAMVKHAVGELDVLDVRFQRVGGEPLGLFDHDVGGDLEGAALQHAGARADRRIADELRPVRIAGLARRPARPARRASAPPAPETRSRGPARSGRRRCA